MAGAPEAGLTASAGRHTMRNMTRYSLTTVALRMTGPCGECAPRSTTCLRRRGRIGSPPARVGVHSR